MATNNSSTQSLISQMEARAKELYIQLESFRDAESELLTLRKAIRVLKGEKLGPGPGKRVHEVTPESDDEEGSDETTSDAPAGAPVALSGAAVLGAMASMPKLSRARDILDAMGGASKIGMQRIGVMLPYMRNKGLVTSKKSNGVTYYTITPEGRKRAAAYGQQQAGTE